MLRGLIMKNKFNKLIVITMMITAICNITTYADTNSYNIPITGHTVMEGTWVKNDIGWWYDNGDGTWPSNTWLWIDGNRDRLAECYCFDSNGYVLESTTTPDGFMVDSNGAWIDNGEVQKIPMTPEKYGDYDLTDNQAEYIAMVRKGLEESFKKGVSGDSTTVEEGAVAYSGILCITSHIDPQIMIEIVFGGWSDLAKEVEHPESKAYYENYPTVVHDMLIVAMGPVSGENLYQIIKEEGDKTSDGWVIVDGERLFVKDTVGDGMANFNQEHEGITDYGYKYDVTNERDTDGRNTGLIRIKIYK